MGEQETPYRARMSLRLGDELLKLIESGRLTGSTMPKRLDTLAARYAAILDGAIPALKPSQWAHIAKIAATLDLAHPAVHHTLQTLLRGDKSDHRLAFLAESFKPAELYAIIDVAERMIAAKLNLTDDQAVTAWAEAAGLPTPRV